MQHKTVGCRYDDARPAQGLDLALTKREAVLLLVCVLRLSVRHCDAHLQ